MRKVDKLSTIRVASVRYSVPSDLSAAMESVTFDGQVRIYSLDGLASPSVRSWPPGRRRCLIGAYPTPRRAPSRGPRARTDTERAFLTLGEPAEAFIRAGAAAGATMLPKEIVEIVADLLPVHGPDALAGTLTRATRFGRFRAADIRSVLAIGLAAPEPVEPGDRVVFDLPAAEVRSFDAYRIEGLA